MIEPGPVATQFNASAKMLREGIDISTADEKTQQMLNAALKVMYHSVQTVSQTPDEVASIIKSVVLSPNPHMRYQTNSKYRTAEVQAKLADPTGDKPSQLVEKKFYAEIQ